MKIKITIPEPQWGGSLTSLILELERVRTKRLFSTVPPSVFFQLKEIFQTLETLGSSRIEGNHTTLSEYVERIIEDDGVAKVDERHIEVNNLRNAISFIEKNTDINTLVDRAYLSHLHKIVVKNLTPPPTGEGSKNPGELRKNNVAIKNASHTPPDVINLKDYFDGFVDFINDNHIKQNQLLMIAIAHHRCAYVHPFDNGNGRMIRLLDYVLLIKLGFNVKEGRILNPSAVFYGDRNAYYDNLSKADDLSDKSVLSWAEYFLSGLKNEIEKIDTLLNVEYVRDKLLLPALKFALDRRVVNELENEILQYLVQQDDMTIRSTELDRFGISSSHQKSRMIKKLKQERLITATKEGGRIYTINFYKSPILRGVIKELGNNGFVADFLNKN